jgi:hypothetical protein
MRLFILLPFLDLRLILLQSTTRQKHRKAKPGSSIAINKLTNHHFSRQVFKTILSLAFTLLSVRGFSQKDSSHLKQENSKVPAQTQDCCCPVESSCIADGKKINPIDIRFDFKSKDIGDPSDWYRIKKGDYVRLKIMNYNPNLYKILIDAKDSTVAPVISSSFTFLDPTNLTGIVGNLLEKAGGPPVAEGKKPLLDIDMFKETDDAGRPKNVLNDVYRIKDCPKLADKKTIDTLLCLHDFFQRHTVLVTARNTAIEELKTMIDEKFYNIVRKFSAQHILYPDCNSFKSLASATDISGIESAMQNFRDTIQKQLSLIYKETRIYLIATSPYKSFIQKHEDLSVDDSLVKKFYAEATATLKKYRDDIGYSKVADIILRLELLALNSSCYISFPIYIGDDVKKINLEFKPRFDTLGLPGFATSLTLPPVQRKVWGISGGAFATGLHNDGHNTKIFTQTNPGGGLDTLYSIVTDNNGKAQVGINALAYTGWKLNENNQPDYMGVCFGAGMSLESKPKPRILLGVSFITGERNRLLLSAGFVAGYVRTLSDAFDTTVNYTQRPSDYLKDILRANAFFSINYGFLTK